MSDNALQSICRAYLAKLRPLAEKFGLARFVDETIEANIQDRCKGPEEEAELLARMVDEERLGRKDVPKLLGKSYRRAYEDGDIDKVKKLRHVGIYSKVSALLLKSEQEQEDNG